MNWLTPPQAGRMMRLVITVGLPAMFLAGVSRVPLRADLIALPISAILIMLSTLLFAFLLGGRMGLTKPEQGALTVCSMSLNLAFLLAFVIAAWGQDGFAHMALFDLGNSLIQGSVIYVVAAIYGGHSTGVMATVRRVLSFPPLWALIVALLINVSGLELYPWLTTLLEQWVASF
jgi:malate permease and related proteins